MAHMKCQWKARIVLIDGGEENERLQKVGVLE